ncbi:torsin-1B [Trichonephila inaurata madagascariensis]|uniref:Torsin-1B n=1 Tax=Trichonephila inaurata madagascariensis TaxID=2747483 RepID=A0A8X6Y5T0_9ARAC|nr:torsin-1B [Trichonephila inaurata madagascariensis]
MSYGIEPLTTGTYIVGALGLSIGLAGYKYVNCRHYECCDNQWVDFKVTELEEEFNKNLFGQHLAKRVIPKAVNTHVLKVRPKKALVMSFHGWTGCGKNHVSRMIANHMFTKGSDSEYHHLYIGSRDFPHKQEVNKYRDRLRKEIEEATKKCERSLFIFDEVDKIAPGVLDALKPYIDYHENVNGLDYRRNVFIFLSELVKKDLIDVYVPFLPLEKKHVKKCILAELRSRNLRTDAAIVDRIASQLLYVPEEVELFSVSGCKKVNQKVDLFATDEF